MHRDPPRCPLCGAERSPVHGGAGKEFGGRIEVGEKEYFDCPGCGLIWMDPAHHLSPAAERARYETHRNQPDDPGYRAFLNRLARPLLDRIPASACGLDFGSGPGPTLSVMLEEVGCQLRIYDPFFAPHPEALESRYDFVTCTETVEHFRSPRQAFDQMARLLRPHGWLAVMTQPFTADLDFPKWWYVRDPTHVAFYRPQTMEWIADAYQWRLENPHPSVFLFQAG